jgi:hypothetical protein
MRATLACLACLASACVAQGSLVVVRVDATPAFVDVARLHVTATTSDANRIVDLNLDGATTPFAFKIELPPSLRGTLAISADAYDAGGQRLGSGSGNVAVVAGGTAELALCLGASPCDPSDIYVDVAAPPGGVGTAARPFARIGDALALAAASHAPNKVVHVAAGLYRSPAESFPIKLRGGVTLEGAGAGVTILQGAGRAPSAPAGRMVTVEIGDAARNRVANVTLRPPASVISPNDGVGYVGLQCDGGNLASLTAASDPAQAPLPNSLVDHVQIGPRYEVGVVVDNIGLEALGGCNLSLTSSVVTGNVLGLFSNGCGPSYLGNALMLGDGSAAGAVRFEGASNQASCADSASGLTCEDRGAGVLAQDCAYVVRVLGDEFSDDDYGVRLGHHDLITPSPTLITVENSTFSQLHHAGVALDPEGSPSTSTVILDRLVGNHIDSVSASMWIDYAVGVGITGAGVIKQARDNVITNNDVGVWLVGAALAADGLTDRSVLDFGRADDPGNNVIACNAAVAGHYALGDVLLSVGGPATLSLAGNIWDHAPPSRSADVNAGPNGSDILTTAAVPPPIDTSGARLFSGACAAGRVP